MADDDDALPKSGDLRPDGVKRVSAITGAAKARLNAAAVVTRPQWPTRGKAYQGVEPGGWRAAGDVDETGELPEDCPVLPLGYDGKRFMFVDTRGQIFDTGDAQLGNEYLQRLFAGHEAFLEWAWPAHSAKGLVNGFAGQDVRRDLFAACAKRGPFSVADMVRGRGAWRDKSGNLVLHCGKRLYHKGTFIDCGELDDYFYVRRPEAIEPWHLPVTDDDNPAWLIFEAMRTWNMARGDVDCMLVMGFIGVAMLAGALEWRPSVFVLGDAGSGKSTLVGKTGLLRKVLGRSAIATTNATEAGLYQLVGHDSLPICIDEMEGDDSPEQAQKIIKMARDAASGSVRIRGGSDHKGVEFAAQSAFLFSGINPPPIPPASMARLAIIQLGPLQPGLPPTLRHEAELGPKLLRRCADQFHDYARLFQEYRTVLANNGHTARGQDTFGTFLAAAHMLLGDAGLEKLNLPFENLSYWGEQLPADAAIETSGKSAPWHEFLTLLWKAQIDLREHGQVKTVGQVLEDLKGDPHEKPRVEKYLAAADLGLIDRRQDEMGFWIAIPMASKTIGKAMMDTAYGSKSGAGNWALALQRGPSFIYRELPANVGRRKTAGNRFYVAGTEQRCMFISLDGFEYWQEQQP